MSECKTISGWSDMHVCVHDQTFPSCWRILGDLSAKSLGSLQCFKNERPCSSPKILINLPFLFFLFLFLPLRVQLAVLSVKLEVDFVLRQSMKCALGEASVYYLVPH